MDAQALASKAAEALTAAADGLSAAETERLSGAASLTLALEDAGSWTLRWDEATSSAQLVDGEEDGAIKVTTTTTTLVALASKKLSPFTALVHGKLKIGDGEQQHARDSVRDAASRWMPVLMKVGNKLRDLVDAPPTLLKSGLKARITAARIRPDGVTVYDIAVAAGAEAWTVTKRYSELRAAAGVTASPLLGAACAADDGTFPSRSIGGTARKKALDAWLRAAAKACTTERAARKLYPVLGATAARVDAAAADLAAGAELRATIPFAAAGFEARLRQGAELRAALKKAKPHKRRYAVGDVCAVVLYALPLYYLGARPRLALCWAFLTGFAARPVVASLALLVALALASPLPILLERWPPPLALLVADPDAFVALPPLSRVIIAAVSGGALRVWTGWMRAVMVYCVAGTAIVYYLVAKLVNKYILRLEGSAADAYWERRHTRMAPFVVGRLGALGSLFAKLGQYISARADLAPPAWKGFLEALQDDLESDSPRVVRRTVETAFGKKIEEVFDKFEWTPVASASIAQVHRATLKDGRVVAVKVRHSHIVKVFSGDLARAIKIFDFCSRFNEVFKIQADICRAWEREAHKELDLTYEVAATSEVRRFLETRRASSRTVNLVSEFSGPAAFVMGWEALHCKVDDKDALAVHGVDATALARQFAHVMCCQIFELGFFNADPHPGNVALRFDEETASAKLVLLDWGWTHRLSAVELKGWRDLALALYESDVERAAKALSDLGYKTNQDERDAARNVHFMAFILRDTSDQTTARRETKERFAAIRDRQKSDKENGVRERGGRKLQGLPDSFMFVIRCIGMVRGTCAHLGVSLPLVDIIATYARRGIARDRRRSQ